MIEHDFRHGPWQMIPGAVIREGHNAVAGAVRPMVGDQKRRHAIHKPKRVSFLKSSSKWMDRSTLDSI